MDRSGPSDRLYLAEDNKYFENANRDKDRERLFQIRQVEARAIRQIAPDVDANMGGGGHNVPFVFDKKVCAGLLSRSV